MMAASMRSVLARYPVARAKARTPARVEQREGALPRRRATTSSRVSSGGLTTHANGPAEGAEVFDEAADSSAGVGQERPVGASP